MIKYDVEF